MSGLQAVAYTADQPGSIIDLIAPVNGQIICLEKVLLLQCRNWRLVQRTLFIVGVWLAWAGIKQRPKMRTTDVMVTSPGVRGWLGYKEHKMVPMAGIWGQLGFKEKARLLPLDASSVLFFYLCGRGHITKKNIFESGCPGTALFLSFCVG